MAEKAPRVTAYLELKGGGVAKVEKPVFLWGKRKDCDLKMSGWSCPGVAAVLLASDKGFRILDVSSDDGRIVAAKGLVEKPEPEAAPSTLSIIGRYILQPEVFDELERHEPGAGDEIQLTDAMARTIGRVPFHGLRFEGRRFDCGNKAGFLEANVAFALARSDLADDMAEILRRYGGGPD